MVFHSLYSEKLVYVPLRIEEMIILFTSPDDRSTAISQFAIRSGAVNIYDIECIGAENNVLECSYDQRTSQCSLRDSGVLCTGN